MVFILSLVYVLGSLLVSMGDFVVAVDLCSANDIIVNVVRSLSLRSLYSNYTGIGLTLAIRKALRDSGQPIDVHSIGG